MLVFIFLLILLSRMVGLAHNPLYGDEALYINVGYEVFNGIFSDQALSWMFGSYLFPLFAALMDMIGGVWFLRFACVVLNLIAAWYVYRSTDELFGASPALWALILFGFSGVTINLSRQAVNDIMGLTFAAVTLYLVIKSAKEDNRAGKWFAAAAGVTFSLSFLAKYFIVLLPAFIMVGVAVWLGKRRSLMKLLTDVRPYYFIGIPTLVLGVYLLLTFDSIRNLYSSEFSVALTTRTNVLAFIIQDIGFVTILAYGGLAIAAKRTYRQLGLSGRQRESWTLYWLVVGALAISIYMIPLYHIYSGNETALWKHNTYTLLFLSPLAGFAIFTLINGIRSLHLRKRKTEWSLLLASLLFVGFMGFANTTLNHIEGFEHSSPNVEDAVTYLKAQDDFKVTDDTFTVASSSFIYEYYLGYNPSLSTKWSSPRNFEYDNLTNLPAIQKAIQDCALELAIIDDYYMEIDETIEPALVDAGYVQVYSTSKPLKDNSPTGLRMYVPATHDNCS